MNSSPPRIEQKGRNSFLSQDSNQLYNRPVRDGMLSLRDESFLLASGSDSVMQFMEPLHGIHDNVYCVHVVLEGYVLVGRVVKVGVPRPVGHDARAR